MKKLILTLVIILFVFSTMTASSAELSGIRRGSLKKTAGYGLEG